MWLDPGYISHSSGRQTILTSNSLRKKVKGEKGQERQKAHKQSHPDNYSFQGIYLIAPNGVLMAGSHEAVHDLKKIEKILEI